MRSHPGFSLIELLVAIVLADVGLLAVVAGTAVVVRRHTDARLHAAAARAAENRIERSIGAGCVAASGEHTLADNMSERWSTTALGGPVREIVDTVRYQTAEAHAVGLAVRLAC